MRRACFDGYDNGQLRTASSAAVCCERISMMMLGCWILMEYPLAAVLLERNGL